MAYTANNLALVYDGGAGAAQHWVYVTADAFATVAASGYFNTAAAATSSANGSPLTIGDTIEVRFVDAVAPTSRTSATGRSFLMVASNDGTTVTTQDAVASGTAAIVATTATTLAVTRALHNGKVVVVSSAAPLAVTLPQATGTGSKFQFFLAVAATATSHTIKVGNGTDVMSGFQFTVTTSATNVEGFVTSATSDTITLNGGTLGGVVGDRIEIVDVATGIFSVTLFSSSIGTEATPFSATVS